MFSEHVYEATRLIPPGYYATYKDISDFLKARGIKSCPQAVGQALRRNTYKDVPCHRVIKSNGELGKYFGKESDEKRRRLVEEGATVKFKFLHDDDDDDQVQVSTKVEI